MSKAKENRQPLTIQLDHLSPDKYGSTAYKSMSFSPQKLTQNFLFKQATMQKKLEVEKKKVRELQSANSVQSERINQLEVEFDTVRKSLLLQIQMYKQMLRELEDEKGRHIKSLQTTFNAEMQRILNEQDQDSKVIQAEKEELQDKVKLLTEKVEQLDKKLGHGNTQSQKLMQLLETTKTTLRNVEERLENEQTIAKSTKQRLQKEIQSMKKSLYEQQALHKQMIDELTKERTRELQQMKKVNQAQVRKIEEKYQSQLANKGNETKNLIKIFQEEGKRLEEIINNKDRQNANLSLETLKEKQKTVAVQRQLNETVKLNQSVVDELKQVNREKQQLVEKIKDMQFQLSSIESKQQMVITGLKSEIAKQNVEFIRENDRIIRQNERLKKQNDLNQKDLDRIKNESRVLHTQIQSDSTKITAVSTQLAEQNRQLRLQVSNLKEVLMESALEMEKCKQEFIKLNREKERIQKLSRNNQDENVRIKALLAEKDLQVRQKNRQSFMTTRASRC